jgi:hypothetical protein
VYRDAAYKIVRGDELCYPKSVKQENSETIKEKLLDTSDKVT